MMRARVAGPKDAAALAALRSPAAIPEESATPPATPTAMASGSGRGDASRPADQVLLVEDLRHGRPLATLRLRAALGMALPRYSYHVGCTVHAARELKLFHRQRTLHLGNDHTGASELCDIAVESALLPLADQAAALSLLVRAALLCMAERREDYAAQLIVALPGVRDGAGQSAFWDGLGRHFYAGDPTQAVRENGRGWKSHVAGLMPRHPLYSAFLGDAAQAAIAQADPGVQMLQQVLAQEGLRYGHHIDIVDGGPILEAAVDDLRTANASRRWQVAIQSLASGGTSQLVFNPEGSFAARVRAGIEAERLLLAPEDAQVLGVTAGQWLRAAAF